ncbi:alginate lyase family protein [Actinomycetes bacterium KLBMP 9797]
MSSEKESRPVGRRRVLKAAVLGAGVLGVAGVSTAAVADLRPWRPRGVAWFGAGGAVGTAASSAPPAPPAATTPRPSPSPSVTTASPRVKAGIVHPGTLHTRADFDRMAAKVTAGAQPWRAGWDRLVANPNSRSTYQPRPVATVIRGGTGQNYALLFRDVAAAYQNALRWKITGDEAHGDKARDILNAWSSTLTEVRGNADRFLLAGTQGWQLAHVGEMMRGYPGFAQDRFRTMLLDHFYPLCDQFLTKHNDACITNYWANWDLCVMAGILAIGIFCDDQAKIDRVIEYFKTGAGNGSIMHAVPFLHPGGLAQWQESGRDQGHTSGGIGHLGVFCQMAWNQGHDLFGYADNRFLKGAEYVARYNLGQEVPFTTYRWGTGQNCARREHTTISAAARGINNPVWALLYNHYGVRRGLRVPNIEAYAARVGPEGGGGDYGPNSGGYDHLGFGTLTFTL